LAKAVCSTLTAADDIPAIVVVGDEVLDVVALVDPLEQLAASTAISMNAVTATVRLRRLPTRRPGWAERASDMSTGCLRMVGSFAFLLPDWDACRRR
jgi:hypothetical protein